MRSRSSALPGLWSFESSTACQAGGLAPALPTRAVADAQHRTRVAHVGNEELVAVLVRGDGRGAREKGLMTVVPLDLALRVEVGALEGAPGVGVDVFCVEEGLGDRVARELRHVPSALSVPIE